MRYKYIGEARVLIPDIHREVDPGEEFESDVELVSPFITPVMPDRKPRVTRAPDAAKEE